LPKAEDVEAPVLERGRVKRDDVLVVLLEAPLHEEPADESALCWSDVLK
jgi:hypothetical protein